MCVSIYIYIHTYLPPRPGQQGICTDLGPGMGLARTSELREGWTQPRYSDLVLGSRAHPGHRAARSSTEFCRDIMSACRSPSPAPQHINDYHKDMICSNEEKIHQSRMKTM